MGGRVSNRLGFTMKNKERDALTAISESLDNLLQYKDEIIRLEVLENIPAIINLLLGQKILEKIGDRGVTTFKLPQLKM